MSECLNCSAPTAPGVEICEMCWFYAHPKEDQEKILREVARMRRRVNGEAIAEEQTE